MKLVNILKTVLSIGAVTVPTVVNMVAPGLGTIIGTILQAVITAEAKVGSGNGAAKATMASEFVSVSAPAIVQLIELRTGKELADESLFAEGMAQMQEGAVKVLNSFRLLPKSNT